MHRLSKLLALLIACCLSLTAALDARAQIAAPIPAQPAFAQPVPAQPTEPPAAATADRDYVLGAEDVVELEVLGRADFKIRGKIAQDGTMVLPYLGPFPASNKTTQQLGEEVARALERGGFFQRPIIRVDVVSFASRYVTVLGSVASPGLVPINKPYRLSEILARVGGIRGNAADYIIVRPEAGPEQKLSIKALVTGDVSQDPFVSPGDKIFLPEAETFYISGQVNSPGQYQLATEMSLRMAIARAGGITQLGSLRRIKINRNGQKIGRIDLDDRIQAGDVIEIGERIF